MMKAFNESELRKLNPRFIGRIKLKITIAPDTYDMIRETVTTGNGKYGSALIDLSIRLLCSLVSVNGDLVEELAIQLKQVTNVTILVNNLKRLIRFLEA